MKQMPLSASEAASLASRSAVDFGAAGATGNVTCAVRLGPGAA
jgi:hypothetical protein